MSMNAEYKISPAAAARVERLVSSDGKRIALLTYGVSSAAFVLLTKWLSFVTGNDTKILAVQQTVVALLYIVGMRAPSFRERFIGQESSKAEFNSFLPIGARHVLACLPVSASFMVMVLGNALCLSHSSVGSYMVSKASTLTFNLIFSWIFLSSTFRTNYVSLFGCLLITGGIVVVAPQMNRIRFVGLCAGLVASASNAAFSAFSARTIQGLTTKPFASTHIRWTPLTLMGHYTFTATVFLWLTLALTPDYGPILIGHSSVPNTVVILAILLSGILNGVLALSAVTALKSTDPVSVNVVGYLKSALQVLCARWLLGEEITNSEKIGVVSTILGSTIYTIGQSYLPAVDRGGKCNTIMAKRSD